MVKRDKKICYVNPGINIRRPISFIMNYMKGKNNRISILTPRPQTDSERKATRHYDDFTDIDLRTYPVLTSASSYTWPIPINLGFFKLVKEMFKRHDIIHVWVPFYPNTFAICLMKMLFFKNKTLVLTMDTFPGYSFKFTSKFDPIFKMAYKLIFKFSYYAATYVSIYGASMKKYAIKAGVPKRKIVVTPTGIDLNPKPTDLNIRELFNLNDEDKIVLFVGLHNRRKGIDLILKTAKIIKDDKIKFVLVGDGPMRSSAINAAKILGIDNKVFFAGTRLDVHNFYNQSDIFMLPSRGEGLAGVLMEAMIYKVPIVTSDIAGTRDLVKHMENGILCDVEDHEAYARGIKKILDDEILQTRFKKNGINRIQSSFLWKNNINRFRKIYDTSIERMSQYKKKRNVLIFVTSVAGGGAQSLILEYLHNYNKDEFNVYVASLRSGSLAERFKQVAGKNFYFLDEKSRFSPKTILKLSKFIKRNKIDVVHTHLIEADMYGFFLKILNPNIKVISTRHGENRFRKSLKWGFINYFLSLPYKKIVCVSNSLERFIRKYEFIPPRKLALVINGINTERFQNEQLPALRKQYGTENDLIIGIVGRLKQLKGHDYLFKAVQILKVQGITNIKVLVLGEGKHMDDLVELRDSLNLSKEIEFLGFKQNIKDYYNIFDVLCLPSNYEGLPLVLIEAMSCETLVLASDIPNNDEVVDHLKDGILFQKSNINDLAEKIRKIAKKEYDINAMKQNARKKIIRSFNFEKTIEEIEYHYL